MSSTGVEASQIQDRNPQRATPADDTGTMHQDARIEFNGGFRGYTIRRRESVGKGWLSAGREEIHGIFGRFPSLILQDIAPYR